jgi:hypothetical protein
MTFLLAACCGLIAAGSYFAQPLSTLIGRDLNLPPAVAGLIVTVSQLGYVVGLLLLAPLGDLVENRRLLLCMLGGSLLSLIVAAMAPIGAAFLSACFGIGVSSIAVQLLVTLASFMSDPKRRGDVVGNVTSGMLIGVLLAYPHALKRHSEDKCQDHGNPGCRSCAVGRQRRRFYLEASACFGKPYRWSCVVITASNRMALRFSDSSAE